MSVLVVDDDAKLLLTPASGACDPRLLRLQASPPEGLDVEAAAILLGAKLRGQAGVVKNILGPPDLAETILGLAEGLDTASDVTEARQLEASAAACYFDAWCEHPATTLRFKTADARRVPAHWPVFDGRRSLLTKGTSNRKAERPLNAVLNLMYSLAAIEARLACEAVGLQPALGFVHADEPRRDNLALDLVEPVRPEIERFVLDLIAERTFSRRDFVERSDGSIRIALDLVQLLAATMPMWAWWSLPTPSSWPIFSVEPSLASGRRERHSQVATTGPHKPVSGHESRWLGQSPDSRRILPDKRNVWRLGPQRRCSPRASTAGAPWRGAVIFVVRPAWNRHRIRLATSVDAEGRRSRQRGQPSRLGEPSIPTP